MGITTDFAGLQEGLNKDYEHLQSAQVHILAYSEVFDKWFLVLLLIFDYYASNKHLLSIYSGLDAVL